MQSAFWIMRPFNTLFIASFALFLFLLILASLLLHNKETKTKDAVLITACVITLIGFVIYKICLSRDHDFNAITASMGGFNWWGWIPFPFLYLMPSTVILGVYMLAVTLPFELADRRKNSAYRESR